MEARIEAGGLTSDAQGIYLGFGTLMVYYIWMASATAVLIRKFQR